MCMALPVGDGAPPSGLPPLQVGVLHPEPEDMNRPPVRTQGQPWMGVATLLVPRQRSPEVALVGDHTRCLGGRATGELSDPRNCSLGTSPC